MGEEKSRSLTRTEFEAVMKRASELAVSDPYDGQSTLDEAEVFRIASEVDLPVGAALAFGGLSPVVIAAATARVIGRYSMRAREEVQRELEGVLDRLEQGEDLAPPPASWRRWIMDPARRFRVEIAGSRGER